MPSPAMTIYQTDHVFIAVTAVCQAVIVSPTVLWCQPLTGGRPLARRPDRASGRQRAAIGQNAAQSTQLEKRGGNCSCVSSLVDDGMLWILPTRDKLNYVKYFYPFVKRGNNVCTQIVPRYGYIGRISQFPNLRIYLNSLLA